MQEAFTDSFACFMDREVYVCFGRAKMKPQTWEAAVGVALCNVHSLENANTMPYSSEFSFQNSWSLQPVGHMQFLRRAGPNCTQIIID